MEYFPSMVCTPYVQRFRKGIVTVDARQTFRKTKTLLNRSHRDVCLLESWFTILGPIVFGICFRPRKNEVEFLILLVRHQEGYQVPLFVLRAQTFEDVQFPIRVVICSGEVFHSIDIKHHTQ